MPQLNNNTFILLRDFIYEKTGIYFADNRLYLLESKLTNRLAEKNCNSFEEYYNVLKFDPAKEKEYSELYNSITINETYFFREPVQLEVMEKDILPLLLDKRRKEGKKGFYVWSAACSTGEEPYTLAMILLENSYLTKGIEVEVFGSDISERAINSARKGVYGNYAIRHVSEAILNKYFLNTGETYIIKPEVKKMVRLSNLNLNDHNRIKSIRKFDLIFCRNAIIYFSDESKKKIINSLYEALNPGGFLIIGFSESLFNITRAFKLHNIKRCIVYEKV